MPKVALYILIVCLWPLVARAAAITPQSLVDSGAHRIYQRAEASDAIILRVANESLFVLYPLYTAVLYGDTLTRDLLGSHHEQVITQLGYNDQTPFILTVRIEAHEVLPDGQSVYLRTFPWQTKQEFDFWLSEIEPLESASGEIHMPNITVYPRQPFWTRLK